MMPLSSDDAMHMADAMSAPLERRIKTLEQRVAKLELELSNILNKDVREPIEEPIQGEIVEDSDASEIAGPQDK